MKALHQCLYPNHAFYTVCIFFNPFCTRFQLTPEHISQESRLVIEQHILGWVLNLGSEAEAAKKQMFDDQVAEKQPLLLRLLDMTLAMCESSLLEPGFF